MYESPEKGHRLTGELFNWNLRRSLASPYPNMVSGWWSFSPERETVFGRDAQSGCSVVSRSTSAAFGNPPAVGIPSGCGCHGIPSDRPSAGWVKARQRSAASSPEHREARSADRPRSGEGGRERGFRFVEFAPDADVCGALGCVESDGLVVVETPKGRRTLCAEHAQGGSA